MFNNIQARKTLFSYWRDGVKLKYILDTHLGWTEKYISEQLKIVMDDWFYGERMYGSNQ